jgi:ankyrin repeat protein
VIACHKGYAREVEKYIKSNVYQKNIVDFFGWTPLHAACAGFHIYIINILLEKNEDPTFEDRRKANKKFDFYKVSSLL